MTSAPRARRVLLVGGDVGSREERSAHLSAAGHDVTVAADADAIERALDAGYDLAVISADLPAEAGTELCRRLNGERQTAVVLHSTDADPGRRVIGLEAGATSFLIEPFAPEVLVATVDAALRTRELGDRLELAVTISGLGHWEWDVESGSVSWTPSLEAMHGYEPGSFPATIDGFLATIHPNDRAAVEAELERALAGTGDQFETSYEFVRTDGSSGHLLGRGRILRRGDGRPYELTGVAIDVTDRVTMAYRNDALVAYTGALMAAVSLADGRAIIRKQGPGILDVAVVDIEWQPVDDESERARVEPDGLLLRTELRSALHTGDVAYLNVQLDLDGDRILAAAIFQAETASGTGRLAVGWRHRPALGDDDRRFLELFARSSMSAVRQLSDYERQRDIGLTLQRALSPTVESVPGLDVASTYRPAGEAALIGGDWFDVITVRPGLAAVVIGDVAGHGIAASAAAAAVRHTVRSTLASHDDLVSAVKMVDRVLSSSPERPCSTAAILTVDLETGDADLLLAGHPPPAIRRADGRAELVGANPWPLLGYDLWSTSPAEVERFQIDRGETVVLYTDGAIERRSGPLDIGLEQLLRIVTAVDDLDQLVASVADRSAQELSLDDDTIVLAVRRP